MKKIIVIFSILFYNNIAFPQWYQQVSNTNNTLKSIFFINKTTGWACGFETVLKTTDCGNTWIGSFLYGYHKSVFFIDENTGWICGENGRLYKTLNGGTNWTQINSTVTSFLNQIVFIDQHTGIITGNNKTILKTTNSGINWINVNDNNAPLDFYSAKILSQNNYIVTGTESSIYTSSNGGASWDTLSFAMPNPLLTVEFVNQNTGWVSGCCGIFLKTTDGGLNWSNDAYLTPGFSINSMKFIDENGWLAGDAGYILRTTNGGLNWDSLNSTTHAGLYSVFFLNQDTGFVAGYNGLILKTTNGGGQGFPLGINVLSNEIPNKFFLYQNYPNPFNPLTHLEFGISDLPARNSNSSGKFIPGGGFVSLRVFDMLGKEVAILVNEKLSAGVYSVDFDAAQYGLSSGIYFYTLSSGSFKDTKRMILVK